MESYTILQKTKMNINLEILKCKPIFIYEKYAKVEQFGNLIMQAYIYIQMMKKKCKIGVRFTMYLRLIYKN